MQTQRQFYSKENIEDILSKYTVLDYFKRLENEGKVIFERKTGHDYYYRTDSAKYSVSQNENKYYNFKKGQGGQLLKAIMEIEQKDWYNALEFLKSITTSSAPRPTLPIENARTVDRGKLLTANINKPVIMTVKQPESKALLDYFQKRGISNDILRQHTKEVHYRMQGRNYYGIGIENIKQGFELRNPYMKTKLGENDISVTPGIDDKQMIVFEGLTDQLSFLQLLKDNNKQNLRTIVTLNSVTNADKFIQYFKDFQGGIYLCLDGDQAGEVTTKKIQAAFRPNQARDVRVLYNIRPYANNDINDYLKNKNGIKNLKDKNNGTDYKPSTAIPDSRQNESNGTTNNLTQSNQNNESKQKGNIPGRPTPDSKDARNGLTDGKHNAEPAATERSEPVHTEKQNPVSKNAERKNAVGGRLTNTTTNIPELDQLLADNKEHKFSNELIASIVEVATVVSNNEVKLHPDLHITNDLQIALAQFKSGGTTKEGRGILDEYYTDQRIAAAIGNIINKQLPHHGELAILEPSIGTGNFLAALSTLSQSRNVTGFEVNPTTARIAKILHPNTRINLRSFETEFITDKGIKVHKDNYSNKYDLVIGNPPYGQHRGLYKGLGEEPRLSRYEDYFVKRSLDSLKSNGVLAMVLPSGWLNRQTRLSGANLLEAYRLPSKAFKDTQIGTDIVILRKAEHRQSQNISKYFDKHPERILGELKERTNQFGRPEIYVYGSLDEALSIIAQIQRNQSIERIGDLFTDLQTESLPVAKVASSSSATEPNTLAAQHTPQADDRSNEFKKALSDVNAALQSIENAVHPSTTLLRSQQTFENYKTNLQTSPEVYTPDDLAKITQSAQAIISRLTRNAEYFEQTNPDIKKGVLKYIFHKPDLVVNTSLQNSGNLSETDQKAFLDTDYKGVFNHPDEFVEKANLYKGQLVHDFYYTEGNIYAKLEQLDNDFKDILNQKTHTIHLPQGEALDWTFNPSELYAKQKALLLSVKPQPKTLDQIIISPNHEFVHKFDLGTIERQQFNYETRQNETVTVPYTLAERFKDFVETLSPEAFKGSTSWEVKAYVDNESVTGSDKERNALVRERRKEAANDLFNKFIRDELEPEIQERFVNEFNRNYNNVHIPDYSNFPLFSSIHQNFKGSPLVLTEVQKSGIGQLTTKGVGLLAHEVGFGKTLSGIITLHEAMHRGNAKRPVVVVPNDNILKQWLDTIYEIIPDAKVNVLGNLGADFDLSNFKVKDGEITLLTYSGFNNIGFSEEVTDRLASRFTYISETETKALKTISKRDIEIQKAKQEELKGTMKRGKLYDWEDFGFDHLTFDEVHNANHIIGKVKIQDRRFSSDFRSQQQRTSALGINTWMAAQYLQDKNDGRNVTLLSATPFTNKPLEYYSILSLIANDRLEEQGFFNVNTFFETFMEADNDMEIDALNNVKYKTNVRRFKNNTLFQNLLREFIDIKGTDDNPELLRPNRVNKEYKVEQDDLTKEQYEALMDGFDQEEEGAILTHILNARLIAISPYLSPYYEGAKPTSTQFVENSPKLLTTMNLIAQNRKDKPEAGQIIYSELAVDQFPKLKDYLVNTVGFSKDEVQIITGATTKNQRLKIQDDFNAGKAKVIIGSSAIQEGMNLQQNTSDLYLLSLPYNFTSLRQVEGRAWRQGNQWPNVRINYMLTNDSIDVFMLQKLQAKQARYQEAMQKGADVIDISDIDTKQLKTALITNPATRAEIEVKVLEKRLQQQKAQHLADEAFVLRKHKSFLDVQQVLTNAKENLQRYIEYAAEEPEDGYWYNQIDIQKANVINAEKKVNEEITTLGKKGVNVIDITEQLQSTKQKLQAISDQIENLPFVQLDLEDQYKQEKQARSENNNLMDYVQQRAKENLTFFRPSNDTSWMQHYSDIKDKYPDTIVFYEHHDNYHVLGEEAKTTSRLLSSPLTEIRSNFQTSFPIVDLEQNLRKFVRAGLRVAVVNPLQNQNNVQSHEPAADKSLLTNSHNEELNRTTSFRR